MAEGVLMATGHIIGGPVDVDYDGAVLTADLAVGDLVLAVDDGADFDEDAAVHGGQVIIGMELGDDGDLDPATGTVLDYTTWDDDASTVTLAAASTVAASSGDRVYIANPVSGLPVGELVVDVAIDGADTTGDALRATLDLALLDTVGDVDLDGLAVEVDTDEDDQLVIRQIFGLGRKMARIRWKVDTHTVTDTGDQTFRITYRPIAGSELLRWGGQAQPHTGFSRDQWDLTVPDPDDAIEVGEIIEFQYAYDDPTLRPTIPASLTLVGYSEITATASSIALPTGTAEGNLLVLGMVNYRPGVAPSSADPRITAHESVVNSSGVGGAATNGGFYAGYGFEDGSGAALVVSPGGAGDSVVGVLAAFRRTGTVDHTWTGLRDAVADGNAYSVTPPADAVMSIAVLVGQAGVTRVPFTTDSGSGYTTVRSQSDTALAITDVLIAYSPTGGTGHFHGLSTPSVWAGMGIGIGDD